MGRPTFFFSLPPPRPRPAPPPPPSSSSSSSSSISLSQSESSVAARAARALRRGLRAASARPVTPLVVLFTANTVNAVVCTRLCAATTALLVLATYSENMSCCGTNVSISPRPGPHAPAQPQGGPSTPTTAGAQEGRTADCAPLLLPPLPRHLTAARRYTCISPRPCSSAAQASAESSKEVSRSQGVTAPCLRPCTRRDAPLCRPPQRVLIHAHRRALRTSARPWCQLCETGDGTPGHLCRLHCQRRR